MQNSIFHCRDTKFIRHENISVLKIISMENEMIKR